MADRKVTDLSGLNQAPSANDVLHIVDVSDSTDDPAGTSKKITVANLVSALITAALQPYYTEQEINTILSSYVQSSALTAILGDYALTSEVPEVPSFADNETPAGVINGSNTTFTLAQAPSPAGSLLLFRNRTLMVLGTDYTLSGANLVFSTPPPSGAIIRAWYRY